MHSDGTVTWQCQDVCLKSTNLGVLCGTTPHLTNFAILLGGGGGSGRREDPCLDGELYIEGSFNTHIIILACVTGFVLLCCLGVILFFSCTPIGTRLLYGPEGMRIVLTRKNILAVDDDFEEDGGL